MGANSIHHATALLRTRLRMASSLKIRPPKFMLEEMGGGWAVSIYVLRFAASRA
jgi:hypothetical protein